MSGESSAIAFSSSARGASSRTTPTKKTTASLKTKLIRNRKGRAFCLGLSCLLFLIFALEIGSLFWSWKVASGVGMAIASMSVLFIIALWIFVISFAQGVFRLKAVNCLVYLVGGILSAVFLSKSQISPVFTGFGIVGSLIVFLQLLAQLPSSQSSIAIFLHPFVDDRMFTRLEISKSISPRAPQHRQRSMSIFRDWPAPTPFPAKALYSYTAKSSSELSFTKGEPLTILDCRGNWWQARHPTTGGVGFVPSNFIAVLRKAKVIKNFTASGPDEVSILEGHVVEVMEQHENMSLIRGVDARIGSVDSICLEFFKPDEAPIPASPKKLEKENIPPPRVTISNASDSEPVTPLNKASP
jgi:hypothetical protein